MNLAQTHPELRIVARILQQASIPLATHAQFDQQWTPVYLEQSFQWTDHLAGLLRQTTPESTTRNIGGGDGAIDIIRSFLETLQDGYDDDTAVMGNGVTQDELPSEEELLDPSAALRKRLLKNPGLSDSALMAILLNRDSRTGLNDDTLTIVSNNAMDDLIAGVRSHFLQLGKIVPILNHDNIMKNVSAESIDRKAKARLIFRKLSDRSNPLTVDTAMRNLRAYLDSSPNEAQEVIRYLSEMATAAIEDPPSLQDRAPVDWRAFAKGLSRLSGRVSL